MDAKARSIEKELYVKTNQVKNMKNRIEQPPIIITGAARSGTSMIAGCLAKCGSFGGNVVGPTPNNKKGQFENYRILKEGEKAYLKSQGLDELGQNPLANTANLEIPQDFRSKVENIMLDEGYQEGSWYYKGAKACQIWPVWHFAFPDAKWVIVRRNASDIASSCMQTGFMRAYNTHADWIKWVNYHEARFVEMIQENLNVKLIWPERMALRADYSQLLDVVDWLGLPWKGDLVTEFIEPKLWKARKKAGIKQ